MRLRTNRVRAIVQLDLDPAHRRLTREGFEAVGDLFTRFRAIGWHGCGFVKARVRRADAEAFIEGLATIVTTQTVAVWPW